MDRDDPPVSTALALSDGTQWHNDQRQIVVQANQLIRAAYTMPLLTQRLFLLALSKVTSEKYPKSNTCIGVVVSVKDWMLTYGSERPWRDLKTAAKDLMKRQLVLNPLQADGRKEINFCDSTTYYEGMGYCEIKFGYSISVYLAGMLDQFTQMDLLNLSKFKSRNTVRLYELLSQMRTRGKAKWWLKISLQEFRVVMGYGKKTAYTRTAELKRAVIDPAIQEINERSDLYVEVEYEKAGRTITALLFRFRDNEQLGLL